MEDNEDGQCKQEQNYRGKWLQSPVTTSQLDFRNYYEKRLFLTCEATVRFRATPPAFKLIRKILQSGSLVNLEIAASLAAMDMVPTN